MEISKIIKLARKERGHTQCEMAKRLGVTQSYVSKIETGTFDIFPMELAQLHKVYQIDWNNYSICITSTDEINSKFDLLLKQLSDIKLKFPGHEIIIEVEQLLFFASNFRTNESFEARKGIVVIAEYLINKSENIEQTTSNKDV